MGVMSIPRLGMIRVFEKDKMDLYRIKIFEAPDDYQQKVSKVLGFSRIALHDPPMISRFLFHILAALRYRWWRL